MTTKSPTLVQISYWLFIGLLAYMPVHIFLSTWIGTSFGVLETARIAKDVVMIFGFLLILVSTVKKVWFKELLRDRLVWCILGYGLLTLVWALIHPTDLDAEVLGVVYNTRFLVFFLYAVLLAKSVDYPKLRKHALVAVLASACVVLSFAVVQYTVLPNDALKHVGYQRSNGVLPVFYIDEKPDLERVMSTIRDPNSFGSYVIIITSLALALYLRKPKYRQFAFGFLGLCLLSLWFSFSRSAWLGAITAIATVLAFQFKSKLTVTQIKKVIAVGIVSLLVLLGGLMFFRNTYFVQNVVLHADESTVLEDPNELRLRFWRESITSVANDPLGSGPGTAGLASIRNNTQGTELNENYYLQIASEVGVIGLALFGAILGIVALRLYRRINDDWVAVALLASFAGLLLTNFLVHIWSNEAVAYTWWGLAGLAVKFGISHNKKLRKG